MLKKPVSCRYPCALTVPTRRVVVSRSRKRKRPSRCRLHDGSSSCPENSFGSAHYNQPSCPLRNFSVGKVSAFELGHERGQIVLDFQDFTLLLPPVTEELKRVDVSNNAPSFCLDVGREATYADICSDLSQEPKSVDTHGQTCTDSVAHERKTSSVQTPAGKRRITNQRVPGHIALPKDVECNHAPTKGQLCAGFVSQKRKMSGVQRQCGHRLITHQRVTGHTTVTDDVRSSNAQIKDLFLTTKKWKEQHETC